MKGIPQLSENFKNTYMLELHAILKAFICCRYMAEIESFAS